MDSIYKSYVTANKHINERNNNSEPPAAIFSGGKCSFGQKALIYSNFNSFTPEQRKVIKTLDSRLELDKSVLSPSGYFRVHFDTAGINIPAYDPLLSAAENVRKICQALDSVYSFEITYLGYPVPPSDNNAGGDNCYDIYIVEYPPDSYGGTQPETEIYPARWSSFITIDNDYKEHDTHGFDAAYVTLAHEFHHAIQMGCYRLNYEDTFFHELTSTSMEEFVFTDVNDYYNYLTEYFHSVEETFSSHRGYDLAIWNLMLKEMYGFDIIKRQWVLFRDSPALAAINMSLNEHQSSFKIALKEFGMWTFYTGQRAIPGKYFKEAGFYPMIKPVLITGFDPSIFPINFSSLPLSNNFIIILMKGQNGTDTLTVKITDGDLIRALNNPFLRQDINLSISTDSAEGSKRVVNNYFAKITSSVNVLSEEYFYNNRIVNGWTVIYAESDYPYPNPFNYNNILNNNQVNLPVVNNDLKEAELSIYSIGMKLVYKGRETIITDPQTDKFVANWNGKDSDGNKLSTGVYIYVTYSNGNIKKGKIVIKNE